MLNEGFDEEFNFGKKKKKKIINVVQGEGVQGESDEKDYDYFELLNNVYSKLNNGSSNTDNKVQKLNIPSIQLTADGTTKTVWCNINKVAISIRRETDHLQKYTMSELAINGSINGAGQLVMKGRFQVKQIETVVRHYVNNYVTCSNCNGTKTRLSKNDRLSFINCDECHATKSVDSINKNFYQAKTKYTK